MSAKQILDINNSLREFIKYYSKRNRTNIKEQYPYNNKRYYILRFSHEEEYLFYKFSRDPYFMAKEGMSETINQEMVKILNMYHNMGRLEYLYFATNQGYIYRILFKAFLKKAYVETEDREEHKTKYIISYKHLERYNTEAI